jgi:hypothetical protein
VYVYLILICSKYNWQFWIYEARDRYPSFVVGNYKDVNVGRDIIFFGLLNSVHIRFPGIQEEVLHLKIQLRDNWSLSDNIAQE